MWFNEIIRKLGRAKRMRMRDRTKAMFAEELEEMLREMPLSKVRVSRLCERCGATTPTFYYYFHDKYELVAWVFLRDYSHVTGDSAREYTPELLNEMNDRLESRKLFYQRCFEDSGQNCIDEYCSDFNMRMAERAFSHAHDGAAMSAEQRSAVRYHNYGVMGMFRDWLFDRGSLTSAEMSSFLFERTPDFLKEAYGSYPHSMDETLSQVGKDTRRIKEAGMQRSGLRR